MLGHIKPSFSKKQDAQSYRNAYCGICASLRHTHGQPFALLVNHELTFVLLALSPFYEAENITMRTSCPAKAYLYTHQTKKHHVIDKAADLSVLLAFLKIKDYEVDKKSLLAKGALKLLTKKQVQIYEHLQKTTQKIIDEHIQLIIQMPIAFEETMQSAGKLGQAMFNELAKDIDIPIHQKLQLQEFFYHLGELIPLADALTDWTEDQASNAYNPILTKAIQENTPLEESYWHYRHQFQRLLYQLNQSLHKLDNAVLTEWLTSALRRLQQKINQTSISPSCKIYSTKAVFAHKDCDCDCNCGDGCSCDSCDCCSCESCSCTNCSLCDCGNSNEDSSSCSLCDCDGSDVVDEVEMPKRKKKKNQLDQNNDGL